MTALTLYELEENLTAMAETADLVPVEQEAEFLASFQAALLSAADKRDRVSQFLSHIEQQCLFADAEIARLRERKSALRNAGERIETYVIHVIEGLGTDGRGRYRKLEGHGATMSLHLCPPSVKVLDETAIPAQYKTTSLNLPAVLWAEILDWLHPETRSQAERAVCCETVDKKAIRAEMETGATVPGADLVIGKHSLQRK